MRRKGADHAPPHPQKTAKKTEGCSKLQRRKGATAHLSQEGATGDRRGRRPLQHASAALPIRGGAPPSPHFRLPHNAYSNEAGERGDRAKRAYDERVHICKQTAKTKAASLAFQSLDRQGQGRKSACRWLLHEAPNDRGVTTDAPPPGSRQRLRARGLRNHTPSRLRKRPPTPTRLP